jgi:hypothetical protein
MVGGGLRLKLPWGLLKRLGVGFSEDCITPQLGEAAEHMMAAGPNTFVLGQVHAACCICKPT